MRVQRSARRRRGAAAVEMALVSPMIVALFIGQFEAARLGMATQLLTTAAREGCRVAVLPGYTQTDVQTHINDVLSGSGISVGTITPTCSSSSYTWSTAPQGTSITVTLSVPFSQVSWLGNPFQIGTITTSATMSSENPTN
jgi:Flp pilus assembly protein TadG